MFRKDSQNNPWWKRLFCVPFVKNCLYFDISGRWISVRSKLSSIDKTQSGTLDRSRGRQTSIDCRSGSDSGENGWLRRTRTPVSTSTPQYYVSVHIGKTVRQYRFIGETGLSSKDCPIIHTQHLPLRLRGSIRAALALNYAAITVCILPR